MGNHCNIVWLQLNCHKTPHYITLNTVFWAKISMNMQILKLIAIRLSGQELYRQNHNVFGGKTSFFFSLKNRDTSVESAIAYGFWCTEDWIQSTNIHVCINTRVKAKITNYSNMPVGENCRSWTKTHTGTERTNQLQTIIPHSYGNVLIRKFPKRRKFLGNNQLTKKESFLEIWKSTFDS